MDKHFTTEYIRIAKKHMQRCSTLMVTNCKIKTTRDKYTHQSGQHWVRLTIPSVGKDGEKVELSYSVAGNVKWKILKTPWQFFIKLNMFFIKLDTPLLFKKMKSIFIIVLVTKLKTRNNTGGRTCYTFVSVEHYS